jgi:hypothetical protein
MLPARYPILTILALLLAIGTAPARATTPAPVADPGFTFVDVDGDGLYSPKIDIGFKSTRVVDVDAIIATDGSFDTQVTKGAYHAPCYRASLVVPASVTVSALTSLNLKAGLNVIVHGTLNAPAICLQACANLDLTGATCFFVTHLNGSAGCNATLDGMVALGDTTIGQVGISACQNVYANPTPSGATTLVIAGNCIGFWAGCNLCMDGAGLTATGPCATVWAGSGGATAISHSSFTAPAGAIAAGSQCGSTRLTADNWVGASMYVCSGCDAGLADSKFTSTGPINVQARGSVTGNTTGTDLVGDSLCVSGSRGIDMSGSAVTTLSGVASMASDCGTIHIDGASVAGFTGISLHASGNIGIRGATLHANHFYTVLSDCGAIDAANSTIPVAAAPAVTAADTAICLTAHGPVCASGAHWSTPANITILSRCYNVDVSGAVLAATGAGFGISITAGGGTIDATGASLLPAVQFGPAQVTVLGYTHP